MDALTAALSDIQFEGWFFCESRLTAPWGIELPGGRLAAVHAILDGRCWIELADGGPAQSLESGDVAFLPLDTPHTLSSDAGVRSIPARELPDIDRSDRQLVRLDYGGSGALTCLITASFKTADFLPGIALSGAAPLVVLPASDHKKLASLVELCRAEYHAERLGRSAVLRRLSEILFVTAVQAIAERSSDKVGWLSAINDPKLRRALVVIHSHPGDPWSLDRLAEEAGMSRSSFAEAFHRLIGETPMAYVTKVRLDRAANHLRTSTRSISNIARDCGYTSIPSFTRAFIKAKDMPPTRYRMASKN
ncbi:MAG: AraC family transcriptional regulator [Aquidulcibacter sp.]|jgi:AraC-like DNA-binding protein|uniref:AraC family transcriptional regulator n=1 Tax=Aquidulcibacter sp. TaxID=2052990 RepID=UPI0022C4740A|nr:AraC family transcriptional regulator [Aquidulcibacter sp.]